MELLGNSRFVLGCEGGVSLWDPDGVYQDRTTEYLKVVPDATFEEVESACFPGEDGRYVFSAVSPRLFESTMMGCGQILMEGEYLGLLRPWEHYIPVQEDFRDTQTVLEAMEDAGAAKRRAEACYEELIGNRNLRYSSLVREVMEEIGRSAVGRGFREVDAARFKEEIAEHETELVRRQADPLIRPLFLTAPTPEPSEVEGPAVLIIALSPISDDPRVRRQAMALSRRGWSVHLAGYEGRSALPKDWHWISLDRNLVGAGAGHHWWMPLLLMSGRYIDDIYWIAPGNVYMFERLKDFRCDLVIANEYLTVPLAAALAKVHGADYVVDCHEYARAEYALENVIARLRWLLFIRPYIDAILQAYLPRARAVSSVCDGIGKLLQREYSLRERPTTVRSLPEYQSHPYRPCGKTIRILYHGIAASDRGLEQAIDSVRLWRSEFKLCLRLVSTRERLDSLKERAVRNGVEDRVEFLEPVLYTDMIRRAAEADIGYCVLENFSPQRLFTLPNKFFEYAMAGLAVVCSDLPEMRKVGDRYDHCVFVNHPEAAVIAKTINSLSAETINKMKRKAVEAARELCWDSERTAMVRAYLTPADNARWLAPYHATGMVGHLHRRVVFVHRRVVFVHRLASRFKHILYRGPRWAFYTFVPVRRQRTTRRFLKSFLFRNRS